MVVAGTEAGDVMIIELHPLPKILTTFGKSSGMYVAMTVACSHCMCILILSDSVLIA